MRKNIFIIILLLIVISGVFFIKNSKNENNNVVFIGYIELLNPEDIRYIDVFKYTNNEREIFQINDKDKIKRFLEIIKTVNSNHAYPYFSDREINETFVFYTANNKFYIDSPFLLNHNKILYNNKMVELDNRLYQHLLSLLN